MNAHSLAIRSSESDRTIFIPGAKMKQVDSTYYRANEARERALAETAILVNNRDTHLRAAEKWKVLAGRLEMTEKKR